MSDDLDQFFDQWTDRVIQNVSDTVRDTLKAEAERLSEAQREALRALEQSPEETGNLEESCTVVPGKDDLEFIVQAGGDLTTKEVREGSGVEYDYAEGFEFGTSRQPARPFFWPNYEAMKDEISENIERAVSEAINE